MPVHSPNPRAHRDRSVTLTQAKGGVLEGVGFHQQYIWARILVGLFKVHVSLYFWNEDEECGLIYPGRKNIWLVSCQYFNIEI